MKWPPRVGHLETFDADPPGFERLYNGKQVGLVPGDRTAHFDLCRSVDVLAVVAELRSAQYRTQGRRPVTPLARQEFNGRYSGVRVHDHLGVIKGHGSVRVRHAHEQRFADWHRRHRRGRSTTEAWTEEVRRTDCTYGSARDSCQDQQCAEDDDHNQQPRDATPPHRLGIRNRSRHGPTV